jgi:O-antigen/teichoic acid export membrane protein
MSRNGTRIAKNASILMATQLITWALTLILTVFLPRYLGVETTGQLVVANSIWTILAIFISFGMDTMLTKEVARHPEKTTELLGTSFIVRAFFSLFICVFIAIYLYIIDASRTTTYITILTGVSTIIWTFIGASFATLQGLEIMEYMSISNITGKVVNTVLGITVLVLGFGVYAYGVVNSFAALITLGLLLTFLRRYHKILLRIHLAQAWFMLRDSAPYLLAGLGLILYGQIDVLIISSLVSSTEAGWYGAASRLFGTLLFIPVVYTTAVFPVLTRTYANTPDALPIILGKTFDLMLLVSVPIGLGIFVVAQQGATLLLGSAFTQSGSILALMGIVLIFTYQNILIGQFLISTDRQNSWTLIMIVAAIMTIPLDLILVPWCQREFGNGAIAGALSFIITELGMVSVGIWLLPKGSLGWSNVLMEVRIIIAGLVMATVSWLVRDMFIVIPVIVGAITYIGMIAILRVIPSEDIALFKEMAQGIMRKLRRREPEPVGITGV